MISQPAESWGLGALEAGADQESANEQDKMKEHTQARRVQVFCQLSS